MSYKLQQKPLSGETAVGTSALFGTTEGGTIFLTSVTVDYFAYSLLEFVTIQNSKIENTVIGFDAPANGYFKEITVHDKVTFGEEGDPYSVNWDSTSGEFNITGKLSVDDISINNNVIQSTNELSLKSSGGNNIFINSSNNVVLDANQTFINSNLSLSSTLSYSFERYTLTTSASLHSPQTNIIVSMFSVVDPDTHSYGTMGTLGIADGTFKILLCSSMEENSTYSLYFPPLESGKPSLITPNPLDPDAVPTHIVFKRRSQSAQLVYDFQQTAWVLITSGAYIQ